MIEADYFGRFSRYSSEVIFNLKECGKLIKKYIFNVSKYCISSPNKCLLLVLLLFHSSLFIPIYIISPFCCQASYMHHTFPQRCPRK